MVIKLVNRRSHSSSSLLNEASRQDLLFKSRRGSPERFKKRLNYQVSNFRGVDLSELFNNDRLVFETPINDYVVTIAYPGVLTELKNVVKSTHGDPTRINLQMVIKALRQSFDKTDDVKVHCTCADWLYRFEFYARKYGYLYGPGNPGTKEFPKITNPDDNIGATCKHLDLFLSNKRWLTKAASSVNMLIKAMPEKAAVYLYDKELSNEKPDEEVQEDEVEIIDDSDNIEEVNDEVTDNEENVTD